MDELADEPELELPDPLLPELLPEPELPSPFVALPRTPRRVRPLEDPDELDVLGTA
jgi:hypothetical protein